jgi:hypothetical protein
MLVVAFSTAATLLPASSIVTTATDSLVNADMQAYMAARTAPWANMTTFSFGVYSDIHMMEDQFYGLTRLQWTHLIQRWRDSGNLFGLIVGDLGYGQASHISNVLSGPPSVPGAPPIFYAMGNHELDGVGKRAWMDALYPGAVQPGSWTVNPRYSPGNGDHVYFSFNVGPSTHFIVLDGDYMTFDGIDARIRQSFGQTQLAWLAADIAANANRNILVFIHEPIEQQINGSTPYFMLNDRGSIMDLLAAHPRQKFVFSGHFHSHQGTTLWKGVRSVHVMWGMDPNWGVRVDVNGDQITVVSTGATNNFDAHPMNTVENIGGQQVLKVREDGSPAGFTRNPQMMEAGPENGVTPTAGGLMLKAGNVGWYNPRFISEQLVKITPGMRLSYDIYLYNVFNGKDAVTVQPDWYMRDGRMPPRIVDQNGIQLSRRSKDASFFMYNEDVPSLGGLATGRWYHREFDLTPAAGEYVDGLYLTSGSGLADVLFVYVDNIRFTTGNVPPAVSLTSPADLSTYQTPASIPVSANASDVDGTIARVDFYASGGLIGSDTSAPYAITWTGMAAGTYNVTAVAFDNISASTTSNVARVSVVANTPPPPPPGGQTLLTTQVPAQYVSSQNFELGLRFTANVAGQITAVRFWKVPGQLGPHVAKIWRAGQLLASQPVTGESASGWQEQALAVPVSTTPGTEYVVSVNTTNGLFPVTLGTFNTTLVNGNLQAPAGNNGVYGAPGAFPTSSASNSNYFRDVVFVPGAAPPPPPPPPGRQTLLTSQTPSQYITSQNYELGLRFTADVAGQITAVRFWKVPGQLGPHVAKIWRAGQLLASQPVTGETASGWQEQALAVPVSTTPGTEYVVSVNATNGLFPVTLGAFNTELISGNLHAPGGNNGVYGAPGALPTSSNSNSNYFRDVVFLPGGGPVALFQHPSGQIRAGLAAGRSWTGEWWLVAAVVGAAISKPRRRR